jgi:YVTN family beta-propeller protein
LALSKDDSALWVSLSAKNSLVRISTLSDAVTNTVLVGDLPWGVTMSPSGRFVYVVNQNSGSVSRVDVSTRIVTNTLDGGVQPVALSLSADVRRAYVANGYTNSVGVMQIPEEAPLVTPAQPAAPTSPSSPPAQVAVAPVLVPMPVELAPRSNTSTVSPSQNTELPSVAGTAVVLTRSPAQTVATSLAIAVASTKVNVGLQVPVAKAKASQVVKYVIQLKPKGSGAVVTRTISVMPGRTVKPSLSGKPGTTYKIVITALTKSGKKQTWNGPSVAIPKKKK